MKTKGAKKSVAISPANTNVISFRVIDNQEFAKVNNFSKSANRHKNNFSKSAFIECIMNNA